LKKTNKFLGIFLIILYLFLVFLPVIFLIMGPKLDDRHTILDFSLGLGFTGLSLMIMQFINSARIKIFNKPFGTDLVYHFHRQIGIAAFLMVFAHPILLFLLDGRYLRLLNLINAPWRARAGVTSVVLLIFVVWFAEFRQKLKISYQFWKFWHGVISIAMIGLALVHIYLNNNYIGLPWKKVLWVSYSILLGGILLYTRVIYPLRLIRKSYVVRGKKQERGSVWSIRLEPEGHKGFDFQPGQFAWLTAWKTPFSDTEHPFSMASSAEQKDHLEMSIKNLGVFTETIQKFEIGQRVYVDGPFGYFSIDRFPNAERLVMIPGGIGITPMMSFLRTMADRGDKRPVILFYCNLHWEDVTFREEMERLKSKLDLIVIYTIEKPPADWAGETGFLNANVLKKYLPKDWIEDVNTEVFLCGPTPMMNALENALLTVGFTEDQVHTERYTFV